MDQHGKSGIQCKTEQEEIQAEQKEVCRYADIAFIDGSFSMRCVSNFTKETGEN